MSKKITRNPQNISLFYFNVVCLWQECRFFNSWNAFCLQSGENRFVDVLAEGENHASLINNNIILLLCTCFTPPSESPRRGPSWWRWLLGSRQSWPWRCSLWALRTGPGWCPAHTSFNISLSRIFPLRFVSFEEGSIV